MANAHPPRVPTAVAANTASCEWIHSDALPGVKPLYRVSQTPAGGTWMVDINDADVAAGAARFAVNPTTPSVPSVLDAFADFWGVRSLIENVASAALSVFGEPHTSITQRLVTDADLGEDLVRVDIDVRGIAREEFKKRLAAFEDGLKDVADADLLDHLLIVTSRRSANATP